MAGLRKELGLLVNVPQSLIDDSLKQGSDCQPSVLLPSLPASLVPFLPPHSSCPPLLLRRDEHALGVAFWAVPLLFRHSSQLLATLRQQPAEQLSAADCDSLMRATRTLLLVNADNATAWNARKRRLSSATSPPQQSQSLSAELRFLSFLFSKHPKSSEAWAHRRWTAQRLMDREAEGAEETGDALLALLRSELSVVEMSAERYPKNYHAWLYRRWIVQQVDGRQRRGKDAQAEDGTGGQRLMAVLEEEQRRIGAWNESHMSDHSGWHYRSFVVDRMLAAAPSPASASSRRSLLTGELSYLSSLQLLYPAHESAWAYRRYLLHAALIGQAASAEVGQQWRAGEDEWCDEREAAGCCSSEADWRLERRYARVHRLYVTELTVRAEQRSEAVGEGDRSVEGALKAMGETQKARWLSDMAAVQQVYPRQVWADRVALVT